MTDADLIEALERKIAQLVAEIEVAEARLQGLKAQLDRARLALGAFDPERVPARPARAPKGKRWAPNRPAPRIDRLFADGEILRRTCDSLRRASEPLSVAAIAQQIVQAKGLSGLVPERMERVRGGVREALGRGRLREAGEVCEGNGMWRVV